MAKKNQKLTGYSFKRPVTLIELLIVMIIIAILSVVIFVSMTASIDDANEGRMTDRKKQLNTAMKKWLVRQVTVNSKGLGNQASRQLQANNGTLVTQASQQLINTDLADQVIAKFDQDGNGLVDRREAARIPPQEILLLARKYSKRVKLRGVKPGAPVMSDKELNSRLAKILRSLVLPPYAKDRSPKRSKIK